MDVFITLVGLFVWLFAVIGVLHVAGRVLGRLDRDKGRDSRMPRRSLGFDDEPPAMA